MNAMRARGEIPMASMFPQINVYHRMEEHLRMGLDGERCRSVVRRKDTGTTAAGRRAAERRAAGLPPRGRGQPRSRRPFGSRQRRARWTKKRWPGFVLVLVNNGRVLTPQPKAAR